MARRNLLSRRTFLRGAGVCIALPALQAMFPSVAVAEETTQPRFFGFFFPNGRAPGAWDPHPGPLNPAALPAGLVDLTGFPEEGIWPAVGDVHRDITAVYNIDHSAIATSIHAVSQSLVAHRWRVDDYTAGGASLDQVIADHIGADSPFRTLTMASTDATAVGQGHISWRAAGELETVYRSPRALFDTLFSSFGDVEEADRIREREASILDSVLEDANRLNARLGTADQQRLEQYLESVAELERRVAAHHRSCETPEEPEGAHDHHTKSRLYLDLAVAALACDLTRVATLQYSNSWDVTFQGYDLGEGDEALGELTDHEISHKLGNNGDRALDDLSIEDARRISNARVVTTCRFKARRFANLVAALKDTPTPTGTLYDETLALYFSEHEGDEHRRTNMAYLLAGGVGGFETGRAINARRARTGALHAGILKYFGLEFDTYGNPSAPPLADL